MNITPLKSFFTNQRTVRVGVFTLGVGVGFASGAYYTKRKYEKVIETVIDSEIEKTREYYKVLRKDSDEMSLENLAKKYQPETEEAVYFEDDEDVRPDMSEVFRATMDAQARGIINQHAEDAIAVRREDPYPIDEELYEENAFEHRQEEWTFYSLDGVVYNEEEDAIVPMYYEHIGMLDLGDEQYWEALSDDGFTLFFRNEKESLDVKINLEVKSFAIESMNLDQEQDLEHQDKRTRRTPRKFRSE